jgi:hypothetical protein
MPCQHVAALYILNGNVKLMLFCLELIGQVFVTTLHLIPLCAINQILFKSFRNTVNRLHSILPYPRSN